MTTEDENPQEQASETSPLLGKQASKPIDPSDGIAPDSAIANGVIAEGEDGGDLERQTSLEERQKQYEGQPEMRKKMKVIFPALTIGVLLSAADQTIIVSSYGKIGSELKALNNVSAVWKDVGYIWEKELLVIRICYLWSGMSVLRSRSEHESTHCCESICRHWWWWHDHCGVHSNV
jgi:hypothetical protein